MALLNGPRGPIEERKGQDFNPTAVEVLSRRIQQAKAQGAVNIAVDVDFLLELLSGSGQAMRRGWQSQKKL